MGNPKNSFSLYLVAFLLGIAVMYIYLGKENNTLRNDLNEANTIRKETESFIRRMSYKLDSLSNKKDSIKYVFKTVEKEVEVLTQLNGTLTLDAISITNLDSIDILSEKEYNDIRNELRNIYHK